MKKISRSQIIALGTLFIFGGIIIFSSQYILEKRDSLFEYINMQLYFNQIDDIVEPDVVIEPDTPDNPEPDNPDVQQPVEPVKPSEPTESYVAVLEIPKINLKKGIYKLGSKYNNVNRNIAILSPSDYPDVKNGNFVLAAHSGSGYISFFKNLYKVDNGDMAYVYYNNVKYSYKITYIYKQEKTGKINVFRPYDKSTLMLITCTKNDNTKQTVYVAVLQGTEPYEG